MTLLNGQIVVVCAMVIAFGVVAALFAWLGRCRHPNPHFVRGTGESADYVCYECGRSWPAQVRDSAWAPTRLIPKFEGHDEAMASRAAARAAIAEQQRRMIAVRRAGKFDRALPALGRGSQHQLTRSRIVEMTPRKRA
jgi:hypothetical protein